MEAIVRISGKQYRVAEGDRLTVERLAAGIGEKVNFGEVLFLTDGARAHIGTPLVDGAAVTATVTAMTRGPKLIVYKYKAKKRYRRTRGARAEQSLLQVVSVSGPGSKAKAAARAVETAQPAVAEKPAKPAAGETAQPAAAEKPVKPAAAETTKPTAAEKPAKPAAAASGKPAAAAAKSPPKAKPPKATTPKKRAPKAKQE